MHLPHLKHAQEHGYIVHLDKNIPLEKQTERSVSYNRTPHDLHARDFAVEKLERTFGFLPQIYQITAEGTRNYVKFVLNPKKNKIVPL